MSRETEKVFKELHKYLDGFDSEAESEEELNARIQSFMAQYNSSPHGPVTEESAATSDDFMELAEESDNDGQALKYAKKAFELDNDNLDAEMKIAEITSKDAIDFLGMTEKAVDHGRSIMEEKGYMTDEYIGDFWGITETRPFIRCLMTYADTLKELGMVKRAIRAGEEIIRLNSNDNMGMRFVLMHLHALMEDEESALDLMKQFGNEQSTMMLLPMSVLYFKLGDYKKSEEYLRDLAKVNKDTKRFFRAIAQNRLDKYVDQMNGYGYRPFTIEELITDVLENRELFTSSPAYMDWANKILKKKS